MFMSQPWRAGVLAPQRDCDGSAVRRVLGKGQFEGEGGAFARPVAMDGQGAAHFLGGQGAAVQAEAVAVFGGW